MDRLFRLSAKNDTLTSLPIAPAGRVMALPLAIDGFHFDYVGAEVAQSHRREGSAMAIDKSMTRTPFSAPNESSPITRL